MEDTADRPKLQLKKRSVDRPAGELADSARNKAIFGEAKPRDEKLVEERKRKESEKSNCEFKEHLLG